MRDGTWLTRRYTPAEQLLLSCHAMGEEYVFVLLFPEVGEGHGSCHSGSQHLLLCFSADCIVAMALSLRCFFFQNDR